MTRVLPLVAALAALAFAVWQAPTGLFTPWSVTSLPTGRQLALSEVRWIRLEVPTSSTLTATLQAWQLDAPTLTFRTACDGENLDLDEVRGVTGAIWVAAGDPRPVIGPGCGD